MKTKLSLLMAPFCLGLVLVLVIAACSKDGGGDEPGPSSNSGGNSYYAPSSEKDNPSIKFEDLDQSYVEDGKFWITGKIFAIGKDASIAKLNFTPAGRVSYKGSLVNGRISVTGSTISLSGVTFVDFESFAGCGKQNITVEACLDSDPDCKVAATKNLDFTKPESYCAPSSSSQTAMSSSEAKGWKFGAAQSISITDPEVPVSIGSASFKLLGEKTDTQFDLEVLNGGKIRVVEDPCGYNATANEPSEYIELGKSYDSSKRCFGDEAPTKSILSEASPDAPSVQAAPNLFYFIYSGNKQYFLAFTKGEGATSFSRWPKKCTYWEATESP